MLHAPRFDRTMRRRSDPHDDPPRRDPRKAKPGPVPTLAKLRSSSRLNTDRRCRESLDFCVQYS
jgi:hypothetical protein